MKNTVHSLEGLVQSFFISDISLKKKEEVQAQGSDPGQAPGGPAFTNPTEHRQSRPLFLLFLGPWLAWVPYALSY